MLPQAPPQQLEKPPQTPNTWRPRPGGPATPYGPIFQPKKFERRLIKLASCPSFCATIFESSMDQTPNSDDSHKLDPGAHAVALWIGAISEL